jgi:DNA repair ATPase RecN
LAIILVNQGDVDRAFKYIQLSLKDALFYNAKLRPWQVAETMPFIEKEYENKRNAQAKRIKSNFLLINILTIILLISFIYIIIHYLKLKKAQKQLKDLNEKSMRYYSDLKKMNEGLKNLNEDVTEANKVKEQYIALYLSILSAHIDKLRDYMNYVKKCLKYNKTDELEQMLRNSSSILEKEVDDFYKTFDSSFLTLYPNFVDEFNSLLNEGADLTEIKKGEMLNTELRIFALIRLGIKDSSTIASLLRYSVNTIYNYRAKVKNFAKDRNHFEDQIDMIGSFRK